MAIVELQFREQSFAELVKRQVNGRRLTSPSVQIGQPDVDGRLLDSIRATGCELAPLNDGEITARVDLQIRYYESYAVAQAAGSLKQPPTKQAQLRIPITLRISIDKDGKATLVYLSSFGNTSGQIELGDLVDFPAQRSAILLGEGVVAIRIGSDAADAVDAPVVNRLAQQADWTLNSPGSLIADKLRAGLASGVGKLQAKDPSKYEVGKAATGEYVSTPRFGYPPPPFVLASAQLIAVDACPLFDIDIPVNLSAFATFTTNGAAIDMTLNLSWSADSFWCQVAGFFTATPIASLIIDTLAASETDDAVLGSDTALSGFKEVSRTEQAIVYTQHRFFAVPYPLIVTSSRFTNEGLMVAGALHPAQQGRGLEGWCEPPRSVLDVNCNSRSVSVQFRPAVVGLTDYSGPGVPRIFWEAVRFTPADAWLAVPGASNDTQELNLRFVDPPGGRLPAGSATSVFLMTDCGLRWVDLGVIPADHSEPTSADVALMISQCMAKSAGWKERVLRVLWLPRFPDERRGLDQQRSFAPVRQWLLGFRNMRDGTKLRVVAISERGRERLIGVVHDRASVALQITTDADETLEVRSNHDDNALPVVAAQRWLSPFASLPLHGEAEPIAIAASAGVLGLQGGDGATRLLEMGSDGRLRVLASDEVAPRVSSIERLEKALRREQSRGRQIWHSSLQLDAGTVAVMHQGSLLVATASELQAL